MAIVSAHLVRYFVMTRIYLLPLGVSRKGPMKSHPTSTKGDVTVMGWSVLVLARGFDVLTQSTLVDV